MQIERWWFKLPLRLKSILLRRRVENELDEELAFHLEHKIEEGIAEGSHRRRRATGPCANLSCGKQSFLGRAGQPCPFGGIDTVGEAK
jgi:hypothetical protein